MANSSVLNTASHIMQNIIGRGPLDKCFNASVAVFSGGIAANLMMDYQANPSLTVIFGKYVAPVAAAAVIGAVVADSEPTPIEPTHARTFQDFKRDFETSTSICAGVGAVLIAGILAGITFFKSSEHDIQMREAEKAAAIAAKPVMAPSTIVQTTAQKLACGKQQNGVAVFVNEADGIEYQVPCTPAP